MASNSTKVKEAKQIGWDSFTVSAGNELTTAVKTVEGIAFGFTSEVNLVIMCDDRDGLFSGAEMAGCFRKCGNYSDYAESRIVASVITAEGDSLPVDDICATIKNFPQNASLPKAVADIVAQKDWNSIAEQLKPYIKAVQNVCGMQEIPRA